MDFLLNHKLAVIECDRMMQPPIARILQPWACGGWAVAAWLVIGGH